VTRRRTRSGVLVRKAGRGGTQAAPSRRATLASRHPTYGLPAGRTSGPLAVHKLEGLTSSRLARRMPAREPHRPRMARSGRARAAESRAVMTIRHSGVLLRLVCVCRQQREAGKHRRYIGNRYPLTAPRRGVTRPANVVLRTVYGLRLTLSAYTDLDGVSACLSAYAHEHAVRYMAHDMSTASALTP
jgi:hypothetical protein